jgi:hypothetical protein
MQYVAARTFLQYTPRTELYAIHNVIRSVSIGAKFGICIVVGLNGTLVEAKIRTWDT